MLRNVSSYPTAGPKFESGTKKFKRFVNNPIVDSCILTLTPKDP